MKLPNQYGSVSKLSGRRRKPWRASLPAKYELQPDGSVKTNRPVLGYYRTRAEALQALAEFHKDPAVFNATTMTLAKLYEFWSKEKYARSQPAVITAMKHAWSKCDAIRDLKLNKITTEALQRAIDSPGAGYSTRSNIKVLLGQMFSFGMRCEFIAKNPAEFTTAGKKDPKIKRVPYSPEEIQKLWDAWHSDKNYYIGCILVLIYTGMRAGELLSVRTADTHLGDRYMIGGSKTEAGRNRTIPISKKVLPIIQGMYDPERERLVELPAAGQSYMVFKYHANQNLGTLGMKHTLHDTRYTFAGLMDAAGVDLLTTQKIMGHSAGTLTQDLYTKRSLEQLLTAIDEI